VAWDVVTGKEVLRFDGRSAGFRSFSLSGDGSLLATAGWDRTARLWDAKTGKELHCLRGHDYWLTAAVLTYDGKRLFTSSWDGTVRLWDTATGKELCQLVSFADHSWAVYDAQGRYDASSQDLDGLYWVVDRKPRPLKEYQAEYFDPGLLAKYLGFNKNPPRVIRSD
jgi:WD40 repeat protein